MDRPVFNEGIYHDYTQMEFGLTSIQTEFTERLLALTDQHGVVSGYAVTNNSIAGQPQVQIGQGLAYDPVANRTLLASNTTVQLSASQENYWIVASRTQTDSDYTAHRITGQVQPTKRTYLADLTVVSGVNAATDIKLAKIITVTGGQFPNVVIDTEGGVNRDVLHFRSALPYQVVGPEGDPLANYTGSDATPFNNAAGALGVTGGTIYVRPGSYTWDDNNPFIVTDVNAIKLFGDTDSSVITCVPSADLGAVARFENLSSLTIDGLRFESNSTQYRPAIQVMDIPRVYNRQNVFAQQGADTLLLALNLVSGVRSLTFRDCTYLGGDIGPTVDYHHIYAQDYADDVESWVVDNCTFESCRIYYGVGAVKFTNSFLQNTQIIDHSTAITLGRFPSAFQFRGNVMVTTDNGEWSTVRTIASGSVISDNHFLDCPVYSVWVRWPAHMTKVTGNHFRQPRFTSADYSFITVRGDFSSSSTVVSGTVITSNTFVTDRVSGGGIPSNPIIEHGGGGRALIADDNIVMAFGASVQLVVTGNGNWGGEGTDNTTNRVY